MSKRFHERRDALGNKYYQDDEGNRTYERKDALGNRYYQDDEGNRTYERKDTLGNRYYQDDEGNRTYERKDALGNRYYQDDEGNRTYERKDALGNRYLEKEGSSSFTPVNFNEETESSQESSNSVYRPQSSRKSSSIPGTEDWGLFGAIFALLMIVIVIVIGIPIAGGVLSAKLTDRKFIVHRNKKWLWRLLSLPPVFILGFLFTSELVGMAFWGISCISPESERCAAYMRNPFSTMSGLHGKFVRSVGSSSNEGYTNNNPPQSINPETNSQSSDDLNSETTPNLHSPYEDLPRQGYLTAQDPDARINLRDLPDINSTSKGFGYVNESVELLRADQGNEGYIWYYVEFSNSGIEGWIRGDFIASSPINNSNDSEEIQWEAIPGTYSDFAGDHTYIGSNTITKSDDQEAVIYFDMQFDGIFFRQRANCKTQETQIIESSDALPENEMSRVDETSPVFPALKYACSQDI